MVSPEEKQADPSGIGGFKCFCCGPRKGEKRKWRRLIRRRLKAIHRKIIRNAIKEMHE
jgi:hypothetical protein